MRVVLARVLTLLRASDLEFNLPNLMRAMGGLPIKGAKAPFFADLMASAAKAEAEPVKAALRYFQEEFRTLEPRTSSSIRAVWSAMAAELEQPPLDRLLVDPKGTQLPVTPSTILDDGIPVILDLPTLVNPRSGGVFQAMFHQCLKIALHRRAPNSFVVGIVQDEFQASVPSRRDMTDIMTTARSKGVGGIYATQALSNVMAVYGRDDARAIFGVPNLLIACKNDDADTKTFVSARAGETYVEVESTTQSEDGKRDSVTRREEKRPVLEPQEIAELRRPTKKHWRPLAETFVLRNGETFVVRFDRVPFSISRCLRGVVAFVLDDRKWTVGELSWRLFKAAVAMLALSPLFAIAMFIVFVIHPPYWQAFETWTNEGYLGPPQSRQSGLRDDVVGEIVHTVRRGETLGEIAARYGVGDVADLAAHNGLASVDRIEVGQEILIPVRPRASVGRDAANSRAHARPPMSYRRTHR